MNNLVSIIIPTYNRATIIIETINSISNQIFTNWECLIVDDGSTDNTEELIISYTKKDPRFKYFKRPKEYKKGANSCRNFGFKNSKGTYIKWFDSDDIMHPNFLSKQVLLFEENSNLDFCVCLSQTFVEGTNIKYINKANRIISHHIITSYLVKNHFFLTAAPLWRKNFLLTINYLFDENLTNSDESDFHFRVLLKNPNYIYTDDVLYFVRRGNTSITQDLKNNFSTLHSKFIFFLKVYKEVNIIKFEDQELIIKYILSRQLSVIYQIGSYKSSYFIIKNYIKNIITILFRANIDIFIKVKILFGLFLLVTLKKGYNYLNLQIDIREGIEN